MLSSREVGSAANCLPCSAGSQTAPQHLLEPLVSSNTPAAGARCALIAAISCNGIYSFWKQGQQQHGLHRS